MAAYTANTTGNWNNAATWSGAGIPGSGDTGTINNGVTVTIPDGYTATIGTMGGTTGTVALTVSSGGKLVIGQGNSGALYLQGDLDYNGTGNPVVTMAAGSQLRFVPSNGQRIKVYGASGSGCTININGTSSARCSVLTDPTALSGGGLKGYFAIAVTGNPQGLRTATYCDFTDIDDGSTGGLGGVYDAGSGSSTWTYNTFTRCGKVGITYNGNSAGSVSFTNNVFSSSDGTNTSGNILCADFRFNNSPTGGATRTFTGNAFDLEVQFASPQGCTIQYNTFGAGINSTDVAWSVFDSNVHLSSSTSTQITASGPIGNSYFGKTLASPANPHFVQASQARSAPVTGCIFENWGNSDGAGDCVVSQGQTISGIAGSVALTNGSTTVTGTGTTFTTGNVLGGGSLAGAWLVFSNDLTFTPYQVASVTNNTALTLASNYAGSTTGSVNASARVIINSVSVTNGSAAVTGGGTSFTTQLQDATTSTPSWVVFSGDPTATPYQIQSITSNTALTLATAYAGATGSGFFTPVVNTVITYCVVLGDAGNTNHAAGVLITHAGLPFTYMTTRHNTVAVGGQPGSAIAETHNGFAGCVPEARANLFWSYSGTAIGEGKEWNSGSSSSNRVVQQPTMQACATATTGGSLAGGQTYAYRVSALSACNYETLPAAEQTIVVPAGTNTNTVTVNWSANAFAADETTVNYRIYGRTSGAEQLLAMIPGPGSGTQSWVNTGR